MAVHNPPFSFRRHTLVLALAVAVGQAQAATINVDGAACTLVNAINNANANDDTDGAGGCPAGNGADVLVLKANKTYLLDKVNNQNAGPNGLPIITSVITINGHGAAIIRSHAPGTLDFRLLRIVNGKLTVNDLRISGGRVSGATHHGGGISNNGTLILNNSTVSGNRALGASSAGSGIVNGYAGILTLNNSTVSGNEATQGGGITDFGGSTTLNNSTVSRNRAIGDAGGTGGIVNIGNMKLINSTVSGNSSISPTSYGTGGIVNGGAMSLVHSTVSNNRIAHGNVTGVHNNGTMTLTNSLIANSRGGADCYSYRGSPGNPAAITILRGTNIIEDGTCNAPLSGDPKLAPLLDNGGPTLTHALSGGSPAINSANTNCKRVDQRYVIRPQPAGGVCDIGAFEWVNTVPANMKPLIKFFNAQVANGGIVGVGAIPKFKVRAIRNQLLAVGTFKTSQACGQLLNTLTRLDTDNSPDGNDYVTGGQVGGLRAQINTLRTALGCS